MRLLIAFIMIWAGGYMLGYAAPVEITPTQLSGVSQVCANNGGVKVIKAAGAFEGTSVTAICTNGAKFNL